MKEKLSKIRGALEIFREVTWTQGDAAMRTNPHSNICLNTNAVWLVSSDIKAAHKAMTHVGNVREALTLLDSILADLDSPKLVGMVGVAIANTALNYSNKTGGKCLSTVDFSCDMAQAAINAIKGE